MYASATKIQIHLDKMDEAVRIFQNDVVPAIKAFKGLQHFFLLTDAKTGKGYTIGLFETEADATGFESSGVFQQQVAKLRDVFAGPPVREIYEISAQF